MESILISCCVASIVKDVIFRSWINIIFELPLTSHWKRVFALIVMIAFNCWITTWTLWPRYFLFSMWFSKIGFLSAGDHWFIQKVNFLTFFLSWNSRLRRTTKSRNFASLKLSSVSFIHLNLLPSLATPRYDCENKLAYTMLPFIRFQNWNPCEHVMASTASDRQWNTLLAPWSTHVKWLSTPVYLHLFYLISVFKWRQIKQ